MCRPKCGLGLLTLANGVDKVIYVVHIPVNLKVYIVAGDALQQVSERRYMEV